MELAALEIERARRGDPAARALVIRTYQNRVYAVCHAIAGDDAYDCAQEAFIKVLTGLDRFDSTRATPLGAFIIRIARNTCIDRLRVATSQRALLARYAELLEPSVRDDRAETLRAAVLGLPIDQRTAIALRIWGELDYQEIADIEAVPIGTIRSRLSRAREALAIALTEERARAG